MGVASRPVRDEAMLTRRLDRVDDGKCNEPVRALFVDLDCGQDGIALISHLKSTVTGVPVIAFGSHVATELLDQARQAGADYVMPRSQFTEQLPSMIKQFGEDTTTV